MGAELAAKFHTKLKKEDLEEIKQENIRRENEEDNYREREREAEMEERIRREVEERVQLVVEERMRNENRFFFTERKSVSTKEKDNGPSTFLTTATNRSDCYLSVLSYLH